MFWSKRRTKPIEQRIDQQAPCESVREQARINVGGLRVIVLSSAESHVYDDSRSPRPEAIPPKYQTNILRIIIENNWMQASEPQTVVIKASYFDGSVESEEEIAVPTLKPGEGISRTYGALVSSIEIIDWWLEGHPESRSTANS
ncbi:hypothetical protein TMRH483_02143 [Qipengyuania sp. 483]